MRKEFFGYPGRGVRDEIINRRSVFFTASDGAVVGYRAKDLTFKLTYRGGRAGLNGTFQQNQHLSSSVSSDQPISNLVAVNDKNGLLLKVSDCGCYRCTGLSSVYLPAVSALEGYAFQKCSGLLSVYAPKAVTLGDSAFHECAGIEYLDFPAAATVGNTTFHSCANLQKLYLPSVSSFGANSLQQAKSNISVYINRQDTPPEIAVELTGFSIPSRSVFQVKNETYKKYLADGKWSQLSSHLQTVTRPVVTFICVDIVAKVETLNWGMSAVAPVISRPYYDFKGWDNSYVDVTADVSCNAIFSKRYINPTTTTLDMSSHIVTGTSADYEHECNEINPGVSCMVDGVLTLLSNSVDYTLSYENNKVEWYDVNVGETRTQTAQVKVTGINYYSGMVSTDFTIGYTRNSSGRVTVTFDPCGGDYPAGPQQIEYSIGDTYGLCSEFSDLDTNARRGGHTFLGWFDVDGDTRVLSTDTIEKEQPYTLSAHWETNNFKLSITTSSDGWGSVNGHEMSSKSPLICTDIEYNTVVTLSAQPNFGYHFDHWGWGETLSVIDVLITSDTEKNVSFYPNEHILNLVVVPENGGTALGPSTCKYRAYTSISAYANDGYKFSQWKSDNDVDISKDYPHEISVSRVYSREDNDITVSAMFDILTYTITYDTDGGTATQNPTSYTVESETITLLNDTTKENYEFLGWYDEDENKITEITKGSVGDRIITARWEKYPILIYDTGYEDETVDDRLRFVAQEAGSTIKLENVAGTYKTSTDGKTWDDYTLGTLCTLTNVGDKIYFSARSTNDTCWNNNNSKFSMSGKIAAEGNIQYLLDSTGEQLSVPEYCYGNMFLNCTSLTQAPVLSATTLADYCYYRMFYNCTSLTSAPELPATTLANYCYYCMFYNCTSLTQAPELPATTLADWCYHGMFSNCSSLTQAPVLSATTLANSCYYSMFYNCTSLTQAPVLSATTLANSCYMFMFLNCTSLIQASELPATTLALDCYSYMFRNCTSLTQVPVLSATTLADYCYNSMFYKCNHLSVTIDPTKQGAYQILSVGSTTASNWGTNMFTGTTRDFTGDPTTGTPYYCWGN